jgi:acetylornithine deacetylase/succinyl-diaminopimelate desuccinylase-like protein
MVACSFDPEIIDMINMINQSLVSSYLEKLVSFGPRPTGSKNCNDAADYLYNEFEKMGLNVRFDPWKYPLRHGKNVVATLNGTNNPNGETYVLCAHYDTTWNSPGANDDGSSVAAMLSIAKIARLIGVDQLHVREAKADCLDLHQHSGPDEYRRGVCLNDPL